MNTNWFSFEQRTHALNGFRITHFVGNQVTVDVK